MGLDLLKRPLVGRPLRSESLHEQELSKKLALPIFASDALSSVAYAAEAILAILAYGGIRYYGAAPWLAAAVAVLLFTVALSYRQTVFAYPNGGGSYTVSKDNLGTAAGLAAASALMVDYVMTVAVSVTSGVIQIVSAFPALAPHTLQLCVALILLIMLLNLRGLRESGRAFAVPTYLFIAGIYLMFVVAAVNIARGRPFLAESHAFQTLHPERTGGLLTLFLLLRAFSNGCTALTGVEAISNGVTAFKRPKERNAATTLTLMAGIAISLFIGITLLALRAHVHAAESPDVFGVDHPLPSAISQVAATTFGKSSFFFFYVTGATTLILVLAANTAFNGFPVLASILARDRFLPRQLHNRGDRLVFSNGIILLALFAIGITAAFDADINKLLQLYILGVFTSFTLSQVGMVRHWVKVLRGQEKPPAGVDVASRTGRARVRRSQAINAFGASLTALVLVIVLITKITHGAYIALIAGLLVFLMMRGIRRHYDLVAAELAPEPGPPVLPSRVHGVVLVSKIHKPTLRALAFARAGRPHTLRAVTVAVDPDEAKALQEEWQRRQIPIDLIVLDSPFREINHPIIDYIKRIRRESPRDVVSVFIPEYVVGRWWEQLLHNQSALRLKGRLLFMPGVMVTSVPYQLKSSERVVPRRSANGHRAAADISPSSPAIVSATAASDRTNGS